MKKTKGSWLLITGVGLILCSLAGMLILQLRTYAGIQQCEEVVSQMQTLLPSRTQGAAAEYQNSVMPVLEIGNEDYCALLEIPAFGITLPVADRWDGNALRRVPGRFLGSAYDHTLVIGGSGHDRQFGFCEKLDIGMRIHVTDMTGARFDYTVLRVDRADHAPAQWLQDPESDLVLFCEDPGSFGYLAVRCVSNAG